VKKSGASGEVFPVRCDLSKESAIMDMFQLIRTKFARLDVCVCAAGVLFLNTLTEGTTAEWRQVFDVRLQLTISCTQVNFARRKSMFRRALDIPWHGLRERMLSVRPSVLCNAGVSSSSSSSSKR